LNAAGLPLAPESPVSIIVDGKMLAVLMCSPFELDELAVGHLFARGVIASREDLGSLGVCPDMKSVKIRTATGAGASFETEGLVYSACGAGGIALSPPPAGKSGADPEKTFSNSGQAGAALFSIEEISAMARAMFAAAELYRRTGGLHVAALACGSSYFTVREDVGRHNAVDKVLGRGLLDSIDFPRSVILTSGRIAADMLQKAARAGVPILVSRSIPTTEAYSLALEAGITLVGRIGTQNPLVYTRADRIGPARAAVPTIPRAHMEPEPRE